jgi:hypothetical protein
MAGRFQITCVRHADPNESGLITHVGINGKLYTVWRIVEAKRLGDEFYTSYRGKIAEVQRRQHYLTRRWYLTTNPDDYKENNLDYLGICPNGTPNA